MADATDFIGAVYDTLSKTFNTGNTTSNVFLQMAWPGYSLSPSDFKPAAAPNGPYDPNVAEKTFSDLSNIAPVDDKLAFNNSGFLIDELYSIVIQSAIPIGATADTIQGNPIFGLFSNAQYALQNALKGNPDDPNELYHKCDATPNNWYDENAAKSWPVITIRSTDVKPAVATSPFTLFGGAALVSKGLVRLKPNVAQKAQIVDSLQKTVQLRTTAVNTRFKLSSAVALKPMTTNLTAVVGKAAAPATAVAKAAPATAIAKAPVAAAQLNMTRAKTIFTQRLTPANTFASPVLKSAISAIDLSKTFQANKVKTLPIVEDILVRNLLSSQLPAKPVSTTTTGFTISFKYCRVDIARSWLDLTVLNMPKWYIPDTPKGQYSTGTADNNPGMFPFLPTSFIVIRELKITANWSQDDKTNLANSASFGFFDTSNGSFNQDTFEADGLQVIAWISKLMPSLAPADGPAS